MTNPQTCRDIVRQLWPYLDGALPDELQDEVTQHLADCANCRSHFDFERAFLEAVRRTGSLPQDVEPLRARVISALVAEGMSAE